MVRCCHCDDGNVPGSNFVVKGSSEPELLERGEDSFDDIAVLMTIQAARCSSIAALQDGRLAVFAGDIFN